MLQLGLILPLPTALLIVFVTAGIQKPKIYLKFHMDVLYLQKWSMLLRKVQVALWLSNNDTVHLSWMLGFIVISDSHRLIYPQILTFYIPG